MLEVGGAVLGRGGVVAPSNKFSKFLRVESGVGMFEERLEAWIGVDCNFTCADDGTKAGTTEEIDGEVEGSGLAVATLAEVVLVEVVVDEVEW